MGPVAILVPDRTAQEGVLATDRMEGMTSLMLPVEVRAPDVVMENT